MELTEAALLLSGAGTVAYITASAKVATLRSETAVALARLERFITVDMRAEAMVHEGYAKFVKRYDPEVYREVILGERPATPPPAPARQGPRQ